MRTVRTYSEALLHLTPLGNSPETVVIYKGGLTSFLHWDPAAGILEKEFGDGRRERTRAMKTQTLIDMIMAEAGYLRPDVMPCSQAFYEEWQKALETIEGKKSNRSVNIPEQVPDITG